MLQLSSHQDWIAGEQDMESVDVSQKEVNKNLLINWFQRTKGAAIGALFIY